MATPEVLAEKRELAGLNSDYKEKFRTYLSIGVLMEQIGAVLLVFGLIWSGIREDWLNPMIRSSLIIGGAIILGLVFGAYII